jgi:hypothetical protein
MARLVAAEGVSGLEVVDHIGHIVSTKRVREAVGSQDERHRAGVPDIVTGSTTVTRATRR